MFDISNNPSFYFRPIHDPFNSNNDDTSSDTNVSTAAEDFKADLNESHDNTEVLEGIADGGLASFVRSSTMDDDDCKYKCIETINEIHECDI